MSVNPFDYVKAINAGQDPIRGTDNESLAEKGYAPYMLNRAFSYHEDTLFASNVMNSNGHLPKLLQNDFYINIIRPRKRFSKWYKPSESKKLDLIVEYFDYSYAKAKQVVDILSKEDYAAIKKELEKGGKGHEF